MKLLRFLPVLLIFSLSACVKAHMGEFPDGAEGEAYFKVGLSVDDRVQIVRSKADDSTLDPSLVPLADSLYVDLYRFGKATASAKKETWNRIYFGRYEEAKDSVFRVNGGQWKMLAFHGDSTACGFDKPYFLAEKEFMVEGGRDQAGNPNVAYIEAVASVSNVRVSVNFDESVPGSFYDYFVRFTNLDKDKYKQILRYKKGEERDAYMMASDSLQIEFMAQYEYGDEQSWKYAILDTMVTKPNDHVKIALAVNPRNGNLNINIVTDDDIVVDESEVEIDESWAAQDEPQIAAAGFIDGDHAVVEGDDTGNAATISVVARGGIKHFYFKIDSEYLEGAGVDLPLSEEIDLANLAPSSEIATKLKEAGFSWDANMLGSRKLTYLTMTDFFEMLNEMNPTLQVERILATFSIRIVDNVDKEVDGVYTATAYPITQTLSIPEGNVWAKTIASPELTISAGVSRLFILQVSLDGETWENLKTFESADNSVLDFGSIPVTPATTYYFRSVYNNNMNLISNVVRVTTEAALQIGNPGFEEYHTTIMHVSPLGWVYDYDREWYLPYNEGDTNPWWAVNSKKTMPDGHTAWTSNFCKNFPCTAYSTDAYDGTKSAMVYTVNVGSANTDGTAVGTSVPGEIWLGTADDDGNHVTDGHAFASRPNSVKFWYKYAPYQGEKFVVYISLKDASGNEIARSEKLDGSAASEWTQCEIPVLYSDTSAKASSLYICFKSCASGGVNVAAQMEIAGEQRTAHIGSVLRVDNVELTY